METFFIILLIVGVSLCSYYDCLYYYVDLLNLPEIVGHPNGPLTNIAVNFLEYETGLTRHDLRKIESSKEYYLKIMNNVELIHDPNLNVMGNEKFEPKKII